MKEKVIKVQNKEIGKDHIFIIAEIGSNHCNDLDIAYRTIDAAVDAGADAVKFQSIKLSELYYDPSEATKELHKKIDLPEQWHALLKDYCDKKGIIFFSTPTYLRSVDILEELDIPLYKLASAQIGTFPQLVEKVANTGKPVILSTGLVSYSELESVMKIFNQAQNDKVIILHCNSIYPAPSARVHLNIMNTYKEMFRTVVGFSDHTVDETASIVAVTLGAKVIEKHFTLQKDFDSPDASLAMEPLEFKRMISAIRSTEEILIPGIRVNIEQEERGFKELITTRLILNHDKKENDTLSVSDLNFLRHPSGIDCKNIANVIGKRLNKNKKKNTVLYLEDII